MCLFSVLIFPLSLSYQSVPELLRMELPFFKRAIPPDTGMIVQNLALKEGNKVAGIPSLALS